MNQQVNIAVQIIPTATNGISLYDVIDCAIRVIAQSGISYQVTPFETVLEGNYDEILAVIKLAQQACYDAGAMEVMCFIKIQSATQDVYLKDKTEKYKSC